MRQRPLPVIVRPLDALISRLGCIGLLIYCILLWLALWLAIALTAVIVYYLCLLW